MANGLPPAPPLFTNQLWLEENRNACECPTRWQAMDALGTGLGAWMMIDAAQRLKKGYDRWALIEAVLGGVAVYLHGSRFFYARQEICPPACTPPTSPGVK